MVGLQPGEAAFGAVGDEGAIRLHLMPVIGGRPVGAITPLDVQRMVNAWAEISRPRTVKRQYGVLRAVLAMAAQRDYIGRTPCRGIRLPEVEPKARRIVTPDELAKLADAAGSYRPTIYVGATTTGVDEPGGRPARRSGSRGSGSMICGPPARPGWWPKGRCQDGSDAARALGPAADVGDLRAGNDGG